MAFTQDEQPTSSNNTNKYIYTLLQIQMYTHTNICCFSKHKNRFTLFSLLNYNFLLTKSLSKRIGN